MELRARVRRVQEPLRRALCDPRTQLLPHDARIALAELGSLIGELVERIENLERVNHGKR